MTLKKVVVTAVILVLVSVCYHVFPIYQFYAHRYQVPLLPWGFITLPDIDSRSTAEIPESHQLLDPRYKLASEQAQELINEHRVAINSPGISVAIAIDDNLVWHGAAGWGNIENNKPMTANTLVRIGSTSKALTSAGLATLIQQDLASLDTKLEDVFNPLPNQAWSNITLAQLASHSAGMPHYKENTEILGLLKTIQLNTFYPNVDDAVLLFDESLLLSRPGERFYYSSLGTVLLSSAMQKLAEKTYQQWMQENVFTPLNMRNTVEEHKVQPSQQLSRFYIKDNQSTRVRPWRDVDLSHRLAGGGWLSTSIDLATFGQGFMSDSFLKDSIREMLWTPQKLNNGKINEQSYAIGWRVHDIDLGKEIGKMRYAHHGGVSRGAQSFLMVIPDHNFSLAVNINTKTDSFHEFSQIVKPLVKLFIARKTALERSAG